MSHSYQSLQSWTCQPSVNFCVIIGETKTKITFATAMGEDICCLMRDYATQLVARTRAKKKRQAEKAGA